VRDHRKDSRAYLVRIPTSKYWYIRDGKDNRKSTREEDRGRASAVLARYIEDKKTAPAGGVGVTFGDVLDAYAEKRRTLNEETFFKKWQYLINRIKARDGWRPIEEITAEWGEQFAEERLRDVDGPTVRQDLASVAAAFNVARRARLIDLPAPEFNLPPPSAPRDDYLLRDEAERLIEAATKEHVRLFIRLALATGGRHEAILQIPWSQVDIEGGIVDLRQKAVKIPRKHRAGLRTPPPPRQKGRGHMAISGAIIDELIDARARAVTNNVIEYRGRPIKSIKNGFKAAVIAAGLDPDYITPHALRHTAATWAMQAGVDPYKVAGMLGHTDVKMVMKVYGHHHPLFMHEVSDALRIG